MVIQLLSRSTGQKYYILKQESKYAENVSITKRVAIGLKVMFCFLQLADGFKLRSN